MNNLSTSIKFENVKTKAEVPRNTRITLRTNDLYLKKATYLAKKLGISRATLFNDLFESYINDYEETIEKISFE